MSPPPLTTPYGAETALAKSFALSDDSIPTSLTSKLNNFYLQTPSITQTPAFHQSPTFAQGPIMHTPNSLHMATPSIAPERFHSSPEFIAGGGHFPPDTAAPFQGGLQLTFVDNPVPGQALWEPDINLAHRNPLAESAQHHNQNNSMAVFRGSDSETMTQESTQSMELYVQFKRGPTAEDPGPTIEEFLQADPFSGITTSTDPTEATIDVYELLGDDEDAEDISKFLDLGDSDRFQEVERAGPPAKGNFSPNSSSISRGSKEGKREQVSPSPHVLPSQTFAAQHERSSPYIGGNASTPTLSLTSKMEYLSSSPDNGSSLSMAQIGKNEHSSPSPPSRLQKLKFPSVGRFTMPPKMKLLRKLKSFTTSTHHGLLAGPTFSLEECLSEFHIGEGNYAFQDETARFSTQLGPILHSPISKRKSSSKLPKTLAKPELRKVKTATNLCLQNMASSAKVLKNMESGLMSFQLNLNKTSPE